MSNDGGQLGGGGFFGKLGRAPGTLRRLAFPGL